jgi:ABC-2 type transport system permease protein
VALSKYWEIAKMNISSSLAYFLDMVSSGGVLSLIIFIFIQLWQAIYSDGSHLIEGYTLAMIIWYLVLTESIVTSPGHLIEEIGDEVQSGSVSQHLNKPINYVLFKYAHSMGKTIMRFSITFILGAIVTLIFVGSFDFKVATIPAIALLVLMALTIHFLMMAAIGLTSFWIEDSKALYFIYQKFVFIIGGMMVPLEIFPTWLETISKKLPFSYVAYHPAKLFTQFSWPQFFTVTLHMILWITILSLIVTSIYKVCTRRMSIHGG